MAGKFKISVVLITYNQCRNLKSAVNSVLGQSRTPDQIVIMDDGSTDNTISYLKELQSRLPNIKWRTQVHAGVGAARKQATMLADGELIAVLDSDDLFFPTALSRYEQEFSADPALDLVFGNVAIINSNGRKLKQNNYRKFKNNQNFKQAIFLYPRIPFKHSSIAFKKESYECVGGYSEQCTIKVDVDLILKFIRHDKNIKHLDEVIAGYRVHNENLSRYRIRGLWKWYQLIFEHEKNYLRRINYIFAKTIWELMKLGLETSLSLARKKAY